MSERGRERLCGSTSGLPCILLALFTEYAWAANSCLHSPGLPKGEMFHYMLSLKSMTNCTPLFLSLHPLISRLSISLSSIFSSSLPPASFPPHVSQHRPLLDLDLRAAGFWATVLQREDNDLNCYTLSRCTAGVWLLHHTI